MTSVASGTNQTFTATVRGETIVVTTNGGVLATVVLTGSTPGTHHLGPLPRRRTFGPLEIGDTLNVAAETGDVIVEYGTATPGNTGSVPPGSGSGIATINGKTGSSVTLNAGDVSAVGTPVAWAASASGGTPTLTSGTAVKGTSFQNTTPGYTAFTTPIDTIQGVWQDDILECLVAGTYTLQPKDIQSTAQKQAGATAGIVAVDASKNLYYPDGTQISLSGSIASTTNLLKGNGSGAAVAATPGSDYRAPALIQSGVALILPPSGSTVGANGAALTIATAFDQTYANCFMKFNANEIASGQAAGWYYVEMSSTTAGIVYNNTYTPGSGLPTIPGSKTAFTTNAGGTTAGTVASTTALSVTPAADSIGANGVIRYSAIARWNNSAGTKKAFPYLGTSFGAFPQVQGTTSIGGSGVMVIANAGVKNKQWNYPENQTAVTTAMGTLAVDTTQSQALAINLQTTVATDWVALVHGRIEVFPG